MYEWDPNKARANKAKHGIAFDAAHEFDLAEALEVEDTSEDYGEERWIAIGPIKAHLHVLVYTPRGDNHRIISLRKATKKEAKAYVEAKAQ